MNDPANSNADLEQTCDDVLTDARKRPLDESEIETLCYALGTKENRMNTKIAAALVKAQRAFAPAIKQATNPHFRSRYADLASCVSAVVDALNTNGIYLWQRTEPSETGVMVETIFLHESGESLNAGKLFVPATKSDAQGFGSALTYARRYSLMASCGIAPEDDDGNAASKRPLVDPDEPVAFPPECQAAIKQGTAAFKAYWETCDAKTKALIRPFMDDVKSSCLENDEAAK